MGVTGAIVKKAGFAFKKVCSFKCSPSNTNTSILINGPPGTKSLYMSDFQPEIAQKNIFSIK